MGRKRGSKNKNAEILVDESDSNSVEDYKEPQITEFEEEQKYSVVEAEKESEQEESIEDPETISTYDAAQRLKTTEPTIKLWVDHGHLQMRNGRIPIRSIKECRFNNKRRFV